MALWVKESVRDLRTAHGRQKRMFVMESGCIGMGSEILAGEALGIYLKVLQSAEQKLVALKFLNTFIPGTPHTFLNLSDLSTDLGRCSKHQGFCRPDDTTTDCFSAGFPCQPYSTQWKRSLEGHKRYPIMQDVINHIKAKLPRTVLLENMLGLGIASGNNNDANFGGELDILLAGLRNICEKDGSLSYAVEVVQMNASTWVAMERPRHAVHHHQLFIDQLIKA